MSQPLILGINGSPHRHGNTAVLMGWVLEGCAEAGARVEWIHVVDYRIQYCQGCHTCLRTGSCPLADDLPQLQHKLLSAQGYVVGSPVYEGQPAAQMCTLLDRLCLLNLYGYLLDGKWAVGVATSGVAPTGGVADNLANFFGRNCGKIGATTATLTGGYHVLANHHHPNLPVRARALGHKLVQSIQRPAWQSVTLKYLWIEFLRRVLLRRLVTRNAGQFAGILPVWQERGYL